jgi:predicted nucleic-acid-binding protein
MSAVDTNVLVRLLTRDDARQVASTEFFYRERGLGLGLALTEATWVLVSVYELSSEALVKAIEMLLSHRDLVLQCRMPRPWQRRWKCSAQDHHWVFPIA